MATTLTVTQGKDQTCVIASWNLVESENGEAFQQGFYSDRSVQVDGTFDGMTVTIQGSNDGTNWHSLTDPQGNALAFTSAGIEAISEATEYIRPSTGADATNAGDVTITMFARGSF